MLTASWTLFSFNAETLISRWLEVKREIVLHCVGRVLAMMFSSSDCTQIYLVISSTSTSGFGGFLWQFLYYVLQLCRLGGCVTIFSLVIIYLSLKTWGLSEFKTTLSSYLPVLATMVAVMCVCFLEWSPPPHPLVNSVASPPDDPRVKSAWSLHVLNVHRWVLAEYSGFFPQPRNMTIRLTGLSKYTEVGVCACVCVYGCMFSVACDGLATCSV